MKMGEISGSTLAYIGDAVWSLLVREYLVERGYTKAKDLQTKSVKFVSAKAQASFYKKLTELEMLNDEEQYMFKRGRNFRTSTVAKNTDVITYRISTGFEALVGYWHLTKQADRLLEIWQLVKEWVEL